MKEKTTWECNAIHVENVYGCYVDWDERFYECPDCGEPVYECDWDEATLNKYVCPICELTYDDLEEEEDFDDCDDETGFDPYLGCYTDDC